MTPKQALQILDEATQPANATRISRNGFYLTETALFVIKDVLEKAGHLKDDAPVAPPAPPEQNV